MIDPLPRPYLLQDFGFFEVQFFWYEAQNRPTHHLTSGVAKHSARSFIPTADDAVICRVNDSRQLKPACVALTKRLLVLLPLSDIPKNQHPNDLTILVTYT